jgi:D-cysteine desulfhydrase family pyridoxal phosphate-dependent enzyme
MNSFDNLLNKKENIAFLPTPLTKLENLTQELGGANIYIKRDDLTGLALGGNKTRKLEYLIKEAKDGEFNTVITSGSIQSNHVRQTIAACVLHKIECHAVLVSSSGESLSQGNVLLNILMGGQLHIVDSVSQVQAKIYEVFTELNSKGRKVYIIPPGGSNATGMLGYVNAFKEILDDEKKLGVEFDYIVFGSSSLGTHAGLIAGNHIYCGGKKKIYGISVCKNFLDSSNKMTDEEKLLKLIEEFNQKYSCDVKLDMDEIVYDQRFNESGYAIISKEDREAIEMFAREEAIILDPVYTARAAAGLIQLIKNREIPENSNVLFIHTGGAPALFTDLFKLN